jgi:5-methylcytosine-specific restriction endonuclease McrA
MTYRDDPNIAKRYHSQRWKKLREIKMKQEGGLCERCRRKGKSIPAYIVHHKEYVTDKNYQDDEIFFNIDNLEALCHECHNEEHFKEKEEFTFDINGNVIKAK